MWSSLSLRELETTSSGGEEVGRCFTLVVLGVLGVCHTFFLVFLVYVDLCNVYYGYNIIEIDVFCGVKNTFSCCLLRVILHER
jgi:hypothetical protein